MGLARGGVGGKKGMDACWKELDDAVGTGRGVLCKSKREPTQEGFQRVRGMVLEANPSSEKVREVQEVAQGE